jgi:LPXTG-motif cell wall-anchored protein
MRSARMSIRIAVIVAATCLVFLAPAISTLESAGAASPPVSYQGGCTLVLSAVSATQGGQLSVTAKGFPAGALVTFTLHSDPVVLGSATADGNGDATLTFTLPADTTPGMHTITAVGVPPGQCDPEVSSELMVLAQNVTNTTAATGSLPRTGTNSFELLQIALVLIAIGGLITLATRKRLQRGNAES